MALAMKIVSLAMKIVFFRFSAPLKCHWPTCTRPPEPERVVEVAEDSNGSTGPTEKKISTKEPPKTAAAMRKSQKAKQKENIEQKMLALLSEDRDKEEDEIELAFASIAKRAKVELTQKSEIQIYRCCQCIIC